MSGALQALFAPLAEVVGSEPVRVAGAWSLTSRKTSADGTGRPPYVDVMDAVWRGRLEHASPLAAIAIIERPEGTSWARSQRAALDAEVEIGLTAYLDGRLDRAGFGGSLHGAQPRGAAVAVAGDMTVMCQPGPDTLRTGRAELVMRIGDCAFWAVLLPGAAVKVVRNGIWRLRPGLAEGLPKGLAQILTRGRGGALGEGDVGGAQVDATLCANVS